MSTDILFSDYLDIQNVAFEWAQSYDTKDWDRLQRILAPSTHLDHRNLKGPFHEHLSPDEFAAILLKFIGDKRMMTQHFIGVSKWERSGDDTVRAWHQIRVAHQRYSDESLATVINKGHAHGMIEHRYRKIEGVWKLEGVVPNPGWSEYDLFGTLHPKEEGS
ncbi:MAG: hypothetical protein M1820_003777 [Bogoriella megaspora]|nr:MAG: hypothetical protein M1820_003777 [Bogoriella megaspora]